MKISWMGLLLAPLPVPLLYSLAFTWCNPGRGPVWSFLFFFTLGCIFSYGTTVFLFLPCLLVASKFIRPTLGATGLLGVVVSLAAYLPLAWMMFRSSGIDSGPPEGTFLAALWRDCHDPVVAAFPIGGLITALVYGVIARRGERKTEAAS